MSIPVPPVPSFPPAEFTLTSVKGLSAAGVKAGIKASGNPDVGLLVSEAPMAAAGLFTQNHYAAAPVTLSKAHLVRSNGLVRAIIVNSGNANACTGVQGDKDALEMCERVARALGCPLEQVLVCSTGVIGVKLPMDKVRAGIDAAVMTLPRYGPMTLPAVIEPQRLPRFANARAAGSRLGHVNMSFAISSTGVVVPGTVDFSTVTTPTLARALLDALPSWKFVPASVGGCPVPSLVTQSFSFVFPP